MTVDIRVLGCYGGSAPGMRPPSFLIGDHVAIDAGGLTPALSLEEQALVSHIFLSHSHIDHLATLPYLLDNVLSRAENAVSLYGPEGTIRCLSEHLFNGVLWPDFSRISNPKTVIMKMNQLDCGQSMKVHDVEITPFPMEHEVECHGHLVQGPESSVAICSDTSSTKGLLEVFPKAKNLRAVVLEVSFPKRMAEIATLSKHISTESFIREIERIPQHVEVLVSHVKPAYVDEIRQEILSLGLKNVSFLEQEKEYRF